MPHALGKLLLCMHTSIYTLHVTTLSSPHFVNFFPPRSVTGVYARSLIQSIVFPSKRQWPLSKQMEVHETLGFK